MPEIVDGYTHVLTEHFFEELTDTFGFQGLSGRPEFLWDVEKRKEDMADYGVDKQIIAIGISELVPVLTVVIVGVPFIILNMWEGTQNMDREITEMADFFGASRFQRVRDILLPQLLQYLFPSMYWGLVVSWKVLFIAEVFGAGSGVGFMINYWFQQQRVDLLLGWVIVPVLLIILAQEGLRAAEHRIMKWR